MGHICSSTCPVCGETKTWFELTWDDIMTTPIGSLRSMELTQTQADDLINIIRQRARLPG